MKGFTLLEVLLSVALIGIISGVSMFLSHSFQTQSALDTAARSYGEFSRRAQIRSGGVENDTSWGVNISSSTITLFQGTVFALRESSFDETYVIPSNVTVSGVQEIIFTKVTSTPSPFGTTTFSNRKGESRAVFINQKGIVDF